ncbi:MULTISPECIES: TRAP transporter permease [Ectothiorhodospira]|uniref:TRAP transporter permease n=1 Tax=Ectothiorhodospira TaxID=1051 RepID=UPI001EE85E4F|nr:MULTISPECIES: TRAP transporter permease [Ectothiorhodospira]MCG5494945.1 TRAP transporter permease [Ectothiorhodospira variabilis]MCG5504458.1 TRAP transporter permease [Ectothiorhodospira variabilis]MCG5507676.1 TRAP transporter permease [Ectothiorhodospira variabilis]MCG5523791.1 TRAP transporter permease [Ectothiorhodospira haloalkaliphila]
MTSSEKSGPAEDKDIVAAAAAAAEEGTSSQRNLTRWQYWLLFALGLTYTSFHLLVLNVFPMETWTFRILHVAGALVIGFAIVAACVPPSEQSPGRRWLLELLPMVITVGAALYAVGAVIAAYLMRHVWGYDSWSMPDWLFQSFGWTLLATTVLGILFAWVFKPRSDRIGWYDWSLMAASVSVGAYLVFHLEDLQFRAGVMPTQPDFWVSVAGILLILELTRRVAGMALVVIAAVFILYGFIGPWLPGVLEHGGYNADRFFTYLYTDNGILGPTTAVSSTYIILFIAFAAFLQASKVGDYFVNFAFAAAGRARGGPAKVAIFASGLMGMINGTSAGNVVATGSLTIPLMKRVGYNPRSSGAIEAAASTGGQIMPPVMGAGAFIMAEITGIPYTELIIAALIPAVLYFASVYFMVDLEAAKTGMKGLPSKELPKVGKLLRQLYLFAPIIILIGALFMGYSVIRAGTVALMSAVVVSWLTPFRLGIIGSAKALELAARMAIQLIAVCACAGIIVGVIGLTGVGLRFSTMLLAVADNSQLLALFFAMGISVILGMGMPTTAAYAVAASVVAPGLIQMGVEPLVAHFFVFYYAVISAITPPVALAAYAGAAIAGSEPMRTSVTAFKIGLAAFIVPFIFFYHPALLMEGEWWKITQSFLTALLGVFMLAAAAQGWFFGLASSVVRGLLFIGALMAISGDLLSDAVGLGMGVVLLLWQLKVSGGKPKPPVAEAS